MADQAQANKGEDKHLKKVEETSLEVGEVEIRLKTIIPEDTLVNVTVEAITDGETAETQITFGSLPETTGWQQAWKRRLNKAFNALHRLGWEGVLLGLALLVYIITRLISISEFPIFFFTDEAVQTVLAQDLVRDGFYSYEDELLPTYFYNGYQYNLSASVYLQVLPYMLLGKSAAITRGTAALTTLLAALALGAIFLQVFKLQHAWSAVLLFSITPAWFLHSRTAFETSLGVTFFAVFLYFYLMYRTRSANFLYPAILAGALTFYSYSPARVVIVLAAALLFFTDLPYHWRQRKSLLIGFGLLLVLSIPFFRFYFSHRGANIEHLRVLNSYWIQPISIWEKLLHFFGEYIKGLNPLYWYLPNTTDLNRHLMKGYGHVLWYTAPLALLGLILALRRFRESPYRSVILALIAAPAGAALVALGITRALIMVIPLALLSAIGLSSLLTWLGKRFHIQVRTLGISIFLLLSTLNIYITWDALKHGPLWYQDYGLAGMQWGARQIFSEIDAYKSRSPDTTIILSPSWANGTDTITRFFFADPLPLQMASITGYMDRFIPMDEDTLFVMIPREVELVMESMKFTDIQIEKTLDYPNGEPGFFFIRLRYVDDIGKILEAERQARLVLQESSIQFEDEIWLIRYSYLDMGSIDKLFDGNQDTLIRTMEANPLIVEVELPQPRTIDGIGIRVGGTPTEVTVILTDQNGETHQYRQQVVETPTPRTVPFSFSDMNAITKLRVEVFSIYDEEPAHVHLWEIELE